MDSHDREEELKAILYGILTSHKKQMTVTELQDEFENRQCILFPYDDLGFSSFYDYIESIPDAAEIQFPKYDNAVVVAVRSDRMDRAAKLAKQKEAETFGTFVKTYSDESGDSDDSRSARRLKIVRRISFEQEMIDATFRGMPGVTSKGIPDDNILGVSADKLFVIQ